MRTHRKNVPQQPALDPLVDLDKAMLVAEHIAHLPVDILFFQRLDHALVMLPVIPGRLVIPDVLAGVDNLFGKTYQEHLNLAGDAGFGFPGDRALNEPGRTLWTKVDFSF